MRIGKKTWIRIGGMTLIGFTALALASCGSNSNGTASAGNTPATLTFQASTATAQTAAASVTGTSDSSQPLATTTPPPFDLGNGVTLTTFLMSVRDIKLEQEGQTAGDAETFFKGPYLVDVLTGAVTDPATGNPVQLSTTLPDGTYEGLEYHLIPTAGLDPNDPTTEWSIYISGSYTLNSVTQNFVIEVNSTGDIEVKGLNGFVVNGGTANLLVTFSLDRFLKPIMLEALFTAHNITPDSNGNLVLSITSPAGEDDTEIVLPMMGDMDFGEDSNHDGHLGGSEGVR